jgi:hypothetical protein
MQLFKFMAIRSKNWIRLYSKFIPCHNAIFFDIDSYYFCKNEIILSAESASMKFDQSQKYYQVGIRDVFSSLFNLRDHPSISKLKIYHEFMEMSMRRPYGFAKSLMKSSPIILSFLIAILKNAFSDADI